MRTDQSDSAPVDHQLGMAKMQGYVPEGCTLKGIVVMSEINRGVNPCWGCHEDRNICGGKPYAPEKRQ